MTGSSESQNCSSVPSKMIQMVRGLSPGEYELYPHSPFAIADFYGSSFLCHQAFPPSAPRKTLQAGLIESLAIVLVLCYSTAPNCSQTSEDLVADQQSQTKVESHA